MSDRDRPPVPPPPTVETLPEDEGDLVDWDAIMLEEDAANPKASAANQGPGPTPVVPEAPKDRPTDRAEPRDAPPGFKPPPKALFDDEDDDERTAVSVISPELLAGATRASDARATSSGLGQMFRRGPPGSAPIAEGAFAKGGRSPKDPTAPEDWMLDVLFDDAPLGDTGHSGDELLPPAVEPSVITSARDFRMRPAAEVPESERARTHHDAPPPDDALPDGSLFDPFASARPPRRGSPSALPPAAKNLETLKTPMIPPACEGGTARSPAAQTAATAAHQSRTNGRCNDCVQRIARRRRPRAERAATGLHPTERASAGDERTSR